MPSRAPADHQAAAAAAPATGYPQTRTSGGFYFLHFSGRNFFLFSLKIFCFQYVVYICSANNSIMNEYTAKDIRYEINQMRLQVDKLSAAVWALENNLVINKDKETAAAAAIEISNIGVKIFHKVQSALL